MDRLAHDLPPIMLQIVHIDYSPVEKGVIIPSNIKYLANMISSAVGVMAAHKQDFQMLGGVDLAAWPTFLGGSRMWVSSSGWQRSILSFNPVDFMSFLLPRPICRIKWWVGFDQTGCQCGGGAWR